MPCAAASYDSLIPIRPPLGEVRLGEPEKVRWSRRSLAPLLRQATLATIDWLVREQLRHEGHAVDPEVLDALAASDPEAARELRRLLGL